MKKALFILIAIVAMGGFSNAQTSEYILKAKRSEISIALRGFHATVLVGSCTTGYYDADGYWVFGNGPCGAGGPGCVDCQWDVNNCGAVGHVCTGIDGYQPVCIQGQCELEDPQGPGSILPSTRKPGGN